MPINKSQFVDPITNRVVQSDKIYGSDSPVFARLDRIGFFDFLNINAEELEYELSKNSLVFTATGTYIDENGAQQDIVTRYAFTGAFKRDKEDGKVSGRVDFVTSGEHYTVSNADLPWSENEFIKSVNEEGGTGNFKNPKQFTEVILGRLSVEPTPETVNIWYKKNLNQKAIEMDIADGFYANYDSDKSGLALVGASTFYQENWWKNAFDSNLL